MDSMQEVIAELQHTHTIRIYQDNLPPGCLLSKNQGHDPDLKFPRGSNTNHLSHDVLSLCFHVFSFLFDLHVDAAASDHRGHTAMTSSQG